MEPVVLLFFASVLIVTAMICWTTVNVTQKIIAYKTASQQLTAVQSGQAELSHDSTVSQPDATSEFSADERDA